MKKAQPCLGHVEPSYNLAEIFNRMADEFEAASKEESELTKKEAATNDAAIGMQAFGAHFRKMECGVVLLMVAAALLEKIIYAYAVAYFDPKSYKEHLDNLRTVSK